jgi:hypothetical protein
MAKKTNSTSSLTIKSNKRKRPGIHSKKRTSKLKKSRNYKKKYNGQGR